MVGGEDMGKWSYFPSEFSLGGRLRILVTGGTGLLGLNWAAAMRDQHEVWLGTHRHEASLRGTRPVPLALDDAAALERRVGELRPELIVHAAALTDVDACERNPAAAHAVNAVAAGNVARAAASRGAGLVQISTDHLFDGRDAMRSEEDPPRPLNAYARSKLEGERLVAALCPGALIVRTNFFGWGHAGRKSFSDWILEALRAGRPLRMFDDAFFTPISAAALARAVHRLLAAGARGVLNVCGDERLSKHEFGMRLARRYALPTDLIERASSGSAALAAPRPADLSLSNAAAVRLLGGPLGAVEEHLAELQTQEQAGLAAELRGAVTAL
jgi:dTDP-4-dehydrorhamnose reductase